MRETGEGAGNGGRAREPGGAVKRANMLGWKRGTSWTAQAGSWAVLGVVLDRFEGSWGGQGRSWALLGFLGRILAGARGVLGTKKGRSEGTKKGRRRKAQEV